MCDGKDSRLGVMLPEATSPRLCTGLAFDGAFTGGPDAFAAVALDVEVDLVAVSCKMPPHMEHVPIALRLLVMPAKQRQIAA